MTRNRDGNEDLFLASLDLNFSDPEQLAKQIQELVTFPHRHSPPVLAGWALSRSPARSAASRKCSLTLVASMALCHSLQEKDPGKRMQTKWCLKGPDGAALHVEAVGVVRAASASRSACRVRCAQ